MDIEEQEFIVEDIEQIVKVSIEQTLSNCSYNQKKVDDWTNLVIENCLKGLQGLNRPFKYIVSCIIMQKTGAGAHTASTCYWDMKRDGYCKVPWENNTMHCIVIVYGLAIDPSSNDSGYL
eukprot:TRINITY_DN780264_c0_g1_i1.p1 TRINITY_DN780264_c0_g1~~TRINITY_DN780264_c0_g1_i1.p1  ORF type:complete len:120 (-),score=20.02 TRINITY_DN780264_c0_g1_i1:184-543(-)